MNAIFPIESKISEGKRSVLLGQRSIVVWFTGLSGSGKSSVASLLEERLFEKGFKSFILNGDTIRNGLSKDLSFSNADRTENVRRIGEVSKIMSDAGLIVISSFISPFRADRQEVRDIVGSDRFVEVFVDCPMEVCEKRDVKGLYSRARKGDINDFTGIDSPYEKPENADIVVYTDKETTEESLQKVLSVLEQKIKL